MELGSIESSLHIVLDELGMASMGHGLQVKSRITPRKNIKQTAAKNTGACPRGGRVVRVHAVLQQLEGCAG